MGPRLVQPPSLWLGRPCHQPIRRSHLGTCVSISPDCASVIVSLEPSTEFLGPRQIRSRFPLLREFQPFLSSPLILASPCLCLPCLPPAGSPLGICIGFVVLAGITGTTLLPPPLLHTKRSLASTVASAFGLVLLPPSPLDDPLPPSWSSCWFGALPQVAKQAPAKGGCSTTTASVLLSSTHTMQAAMIVSSFSHSLIISCFAVFVWSGVVDNASGEWRRDMLSLRLELVDQGGSWESIKGAVVSKMNPFPPPSFLITSSQRILKSLRLHTKFPAQDIISPHPHCPHQVSPLTSYLDSLHHQPPGTCLGLTTSCHFCHPIAHNVWTLHRLLLLRANGCPL